MTQKEVLKKISAGKVGVLPTDTLYAVAGSAFDRKAVESIFRIKNRNPKKPFIILIGSLADLDLFGVRLEPEEKTILKKIWPGKVSVIVPLKEEGLDYLHRGSRSLAFRLPEEKWLQSFLRKSGPLVAPSANPEGVCPATTIGEAMEYFGSAADFYFDKGTLSGKPSALIAIRGKEITILREGEEKINQE